MSYSIHRPSFVFNYLCIGADAFNLFATATWLFTSSSSSAYLETSGLGSIVGVTAEEGTNGMATAWWVLAVTGMTMCAYGGFFLVLFAIVDDHLKLNLPGVYEDFTVNSVFFNLYAVRLSVWCLAVIPSTVVYLTAKFSILPIGILRSLDPEHAQHAGFYNALFQFLQKDNLLSADEGVVLDRHLPTHSDLRLAIVNRFLAAAHQAKPRLEQELASPWKINKQLETTLAWAKNLDTSRPSQRPLVQRVQHQPETEIHTINVISTDDVDAEASRHAMRRANVAEAATQRVDESTSEILARSEVLRHGLTLRKFTEKIRAEFRDHRVTSGLLRIVAGFALLNVTLAALILLPTTLAFGVYSSFFALLHVGKCSGDDGTFVLPCTLTTCYLVCLVCLIALIPATAAFQLMRADVASAKGFPDHFYDIMMVREMRVRVRAAQGRIMTSDFLSKRVGHFSSTHIITYLSESQRGPAYL